MVILVKVVITHQALLKLQTHPNPTKRKDQESLAAKIDQGLLS